MFYHLFCFGRNGSISIITSESTGSQISQTGISSIVFVVPQRLAAIFSSTHCQIQRTTIAPNATNIGNILIADC